MKLKAKNKLSLRPLVSVVIPVFNCEKYIEVAINSISDQTYDNLEIIVVDDGSSDSTWDIVCKLAEKDKRIKQYKNKKNLKIVKTLNFGITKSHGKYIARMDGDDFRIPDSIEKQVNYLEKHKDVVIVGGAIDVCDEGLRVTNHRMFPITDEQIRAKLFRYSPFAHPAVMMRKDALPNDAYSINWIEDYDLYFRLGKVGKFANLPANVLKLRIHPVSVSRSRASYQEYLMLYVRLKAVFEYGYVMTSGDKLYFATQLVSKLLMPVKFRFWLYNKIRSIGARAK